MKLGPLLPLGYISAASPPSSATLIAWYDPADIDLLGNSSLSDGAAVGTWKNKGTYGASLDVVQAVAGAKPTYRLVGEAGKCGNASAVQFDGGDIMQSAALGAAVAQPLLIATVVRPGTSVIYDGLTGGQLQGSIAVTQFVAYAGAYYIGTAVAVADQIHEWVATYNNASSAMTVDGVASSTGTVGTEGLLGVTLGGVASGVATFVGKVWMHMVWAGTLPTHAQVRTYIAARLTGGFPQ